MIHTVHIVQHHMHTMYNKHRPLDLCNTHSTPCKIHFRPCTMKTFLKAAWISNQILIVWFRHYNKKSKSYQPLTRVFIPLSEPPGSSWASSWSPHNKEVPTFRRGTPALERAHLSNRGKSEDCLSVGLQPGPLLFPYWSTVCWLLIADWGLFSACCGLLI